MSLSREFTREPLAKVNGSARGGGEEILFSPLCYLAALSRVLSRLALLAIIGQLARRLLFSVIGVPVDYAILLSFPLASSATS